MPTYVYETIPSSPSEESVRFEIKQSMNDAPLENHPETGQPVRRIISGGYGFSVAGSSASAPVPTASEGGCCGSSCGCSHN